MQQGNPDQFRSAAIGAALGTLPAGVKRIDAPTNTVWLIGRTMVHGPEDVREVAALQAQITLVPLQQFQR